MARRPTASVRPTASALRVLCRGGIRNRSPSRACPCIKPHLRAIGDAAVTSGRGRPARPLARNRGDRKGRGMWDEGCVREIAVFFPRPSSLISRPFHQIKASPNRRQHSQAQAIDLQNLQFVEVVLVPLQHRAAFHVDAGRPAADQLDTLHRPGRQALQDLLQAVVLRVRACPFINLTKSSLLIPLSP